MTAQEAPPWQEQSRTPSPLLYCPCSLISTLEIASPLALPHQMCFEQGWQVRALQFPWSWHSMERIPPEGPDAQGAPGHLWDSWWGAVASQPGPFSSQRQQKSRGTFPGHCGGTVALLCPWPALPDRAEGKGNSKIIPSAAFKFQSAPSPCPACWEHRGWADLPGRLWRCRRVIC